MALSTFKLGLWSIEGIRLAREEDPNVKPIVERKELSNGRQSPGKISICSLTKKCYSALGIRDDILKKK